MSRFHHHLYELVLREKPEVMVETGYANGLSAMHILAAMDLNGTGILFSVESFTNQDIWHPRLKFLRGKSQVILETIPAPWDCFLHDSDHSFECQTFEYAVAWGKLRVGGLLVTDDYQWGEPCHHAWERFLSTVEHSDVITIGSAQWTRKI